MGIRGQKVSCQSMHAPSAMHRQLAGSGRSGHPYSWASEPTELTGRLHKLPAHACPCNQAVPGTGYEEGRK
eukprot:358334-Chlamydomonas_euryale.AAC.7